MLPTPTLTQPISSPTDAVQPVYTVTAADKARQERIAFAWKAYEGRLDRPLVPLPGDPDDNVLSNRCQQIVDRGIDFLFGKEIEISVSSDAPDTAQDAIDAVWGRKETRIPLLQDLAMNGGMAGEHRPAQPPTDSNPRSRARSKPCLCLHGRQPRRGPVATAQAERDAAIKRTRQDAAAAEQRAGERAAAAGAGRDQACADARQAEREATRAQSAEAAAWAETDRARAASGHAPAAGGNAGSTRRPRRRTSGHE